MVGRQVVVIIIVSTTLVVVAVIVDAGAGVGWGPCGVVVEERVRDEGLRENSEMCVVMHQTHLVQ